MLKLLYHAMDYNELISMINESQVELLRRGTVTQCFNIKQNEKGTIGTVLINVDPLELDFEGDYFEFLNKESNEYRDI